MLNTLKVVINRLNRFGFCADSSDMSLIPLAIIFYCVDGFCRHPLEETTKSTTSNPVVVGAGFHFINSIMNGFHQARKREYIIFRAVAFPSFSVLTRACHIVLLLLCPWSTRIKYYECFLFACVLEGYGKRALYRYNFYDKQMQIAIANRKKIANSCKPIHRC